MSILSCLCRRSRGRFRCSGKGHRMYFFLFLFLFLFFFFFFGSGTHLSSSSSNDPQVCFQWHISGRTTIHPRGYQQLEMTGPGVIMTEFIIPLKWGFTYKFDADGYLEKVGFRKIFCRVQGCRVSHSNLKPILDRALVLVYRGRLLRRVT